MAATRVHLLHRDGRPWRGTQPASWRHFDRDPTVGGRGYQEAVLTGVHLGGYGNDLDTDLRGLVAAILEQTTLPRLRLSSLEPWDLQPEFLTYGRPATGG